MVQLEMFVFSVLYIVYISFVAMFHVSV